ncbi:hypothetical protein A4W93_27405 [Piscinibacter gummiphilus]|uniref:Uncharacterized protein n=1 Tax=Piscinibacter gummiphilus TaxID=946333 RepID=A0A1W6LGC9_9BURK|nr:hypothetical protein A4W93_27405 [Piscinibacter gummiphilus]ATU68033.1 hypothetical protein CPZ87_27535 [Piscinibacter gummiphilus]
MAVRIEADRIDGAGITEPIGSDAAEAWRRWAGRTSLRRGTRLRVTVSDHRTRYWLCSPPAGLAGFAELRAVAAARFEDLFHVPAGDWALDGDWHATQPFLCAAMPAVLHAAVCATADEHGWRLKALQPASVADFNGMDLGGRAPTWALSFRDDGFNALLLDGGRPRDVCQHWTDEPPDTAGVLTRLRAQALVARAEMPTRFVTAGPAPRLGTSP